MKMRKEIVGLALAIMILMPGKAFASEFFTPFQTSDWAGVGLTAIADFADLDSSYSENLHGQTVFNGQPRYGTPITCSNGASGCFSGHRSPSNGEQNLLIAGLFGTKYPTALDYTAFGALELLTQSLVALVLPERWRGAAWGLFVGIGAADTVMNSYRGGVTFRF